jgi:acyl carrier protein phosphodiesterase
MNFLAHIYLSGENEKLMVGNFIGDYVKGKSYESYPSPIKEGILLHRQIDFFTDNHSDFRKAKKLLVPEFGLYAGIVIDLFYDHLLAANWKIYSDLTLRSFAKRSHAILLSNFFHLPKRVQGFLPFLVQNKRLESYATKEGIQKSMEIMSRYTSLPEKTEIAMKVLAENFLFFENNFSSFFADIIDFVQNEYRIILKKTDFSTGL